MRLRAVSERRHGLRAADAINLRNAGEISGREHRLVDLPAGRRNHHDDARTPATFAGTAFIKTELG